MPVSTFLHLILPFSPLFHVSCHPTGCFVVAVKPGQGMGFLKLIFLCVGFAYILGKIKRR